jgi:hypothetical protein
MKRISLLKTLTIALFLMTGVGNAWGQLNVSTANTIYLIDFDNTVAGVNNGQFNGSGFTTAPASGQLNSDAWAVTGMSDGNLTFGGTATSGDLARETSTGGVSTGGVYAFEVVASNNALGFQPGASDWTPGTVTLRFQNKTGGVISSLHVAYTVYVRNDQARANNFNFSHSSDDSTYTNVSDLDLTSVEAADGFPSWKSYKLIAKITGLSITDNGLYYLKWSSNDVSGSGSRDEFALDDITIVANPTDALQLSGSFEEVVLASGAEAEIADNAALTIDNDLTNNAGATGLVIESTDAGTGSIIINGSASGNVTVQRYLTNYDNATDAKYQFISSPVSSQAIQPEFVTDPPTVGVDFYKFDETTNTWINSKVSGGAWNSGFEANFAVGRGYLVAYPTAPVTKEFSGTLNNNASYTLTCTYTDGQGNGWNLLGNPYPAAIDWDAVTLGDGVDNALYYYDASTQNYIAYLRISGDAATSTGGSRYIPAGQGFMVHANNTGSTKTVTIEKADLTHSGQDVYYKSSTNLLSGSLSLQVTGNTFHDKTIIHFNEQATTDFDGNYDAFKLMSANMQVPMIYTSNEENVQFAINGLPKVEEGTSIPVSLRIGADETYTIEASINDIEMNVFLEDLTTGISTKLNESPTYSFTASEGDDPNRFLLHFGVVGLDENDSQGSLRAYTYNNTLYVQNSMEAANLRILDLQGRLLLEKQLNGQGLQSLPLDFPAGVYVVQLLNSKAQKSVKVIVE